jgi:hypothetical protein
VLVVTLSIFSASLALDACAATSALVRQRLSTALASQRFAVDQQPWGSA